VAHFDIVLDVASGTGLSPDEAGQSYKIETELQELAEYRLRLQSPTFDLSRNYLHGTPWLDVHHRHRDAPPDQQEEGRSLKP